MNWIFQFCCSKTKIKMNDENITNFTKQKIHWKNNSRNKKWWRNNLLEQTCFVPKCLMLFFWNTSKLQTSQTKDMSVKPSEIVSDMHCYLKCYYLILNCLLLKLNRWFVIFKRHEKWINLLFIYSNGCCIENERI